MNRNACLVEDSVSAIQWGNGYFLTLAYIVNTQQHWTSLGLASAKPLIQFAAPWLSSLTPAAFGVLCVIQYGNCVLSRGNHAFRSRANEIRSAKNEQRCPPKMMSFSQLTAVKKTSFFIFGPSYFVRALVGFLIGDLGHYLISLRSGLLDEIKKCKIVCSMNGIIFLTVKYQSFVLQLRSTKSQSNQRCHKTFFLILISLERYKESKNK